MELLTSRTSLHHPPPQQNSLHSTIQLHVNWLHVLMGAAVAPPPGWMKDLL